MTTITPAHVAAAEELLRRATWGRRSLSDAEHAEIRYDFVVLLASGKTVGIHAKCFEGDWEYGLLALNDSHGINPT